MPNLAEHDVFIFITQLGIIVFAARLCGEVAKRFGQPILAGEVIAGILLGPFVFGNAFPDLRQIIFPSGGVTPYLLQGMSWLCALFLLLIAGLEIDFRASLEYGKQNILTSLFGFTFPLISVYVVSQILPEQFYPSGMNHGYANLFVALTLSVASVPVIGKILFDLKIFRSNVGLNIITSSVLSDIWEWSTLLIAISLVTHGAIQFFPIAKTILVMILLLLGALTAGKRLIEKVFDWMHINTKDTAAVLALLFSLTLLNGALTHLLGIHVAFGAFLTGLMAGESERVTPYLRQSIQDFVFGIFAPIFFVLIGIQLQLGAMNSWIYVVILMAVASFGKISGAYLGALLGGIGRKNALAVGCGLNAQGAMGLIVALIGAELGVFGKELFSILVVICILSSLLVGPSLKWAVKRVRRPLAKFFTHRHIFGHVSGHNKRDVISNMAKLMAERNIIEDAEKIKKAIWQREKSLSTAIGEGIALPHARIEKLKTPILCFFRLETPIDFDSPDNVPVQLIFLELTDVNDDGMQLNLISQVAKFVSSSANREKLLMCKNEEELHHVLSFDEKV